MGDGMPYHLEKGPTLRILERHLNRDPGEMVMLLDRLRVPGVGWFVDEPPPNGLPSWWDDPVFNAHPLGSGRAVRDDIIQKWFGWRLDPATGQWADEDLGKPTTGYWIAYKGDPLEIVREALVWALEISLGIDHGAFVGAPRSDPWPIEIFWKCPEPWFEAWVTVQPVTSQQRAVTVTLMTPSHRGSNVAESPVAWSSKVKPVGVGHPIPSTEPDYFELGSTGTAGQGQREHAMWVVTHRNHQVDHLHPKVTTNTSTSADFAEWGIPVLSIYKGTGGPVIVSPSLPAGGVRANGSVP